MPDRTIAVLPFTELEEAGGPSWFTRGFAEDLITELARFATLEVVHAHSSFAVDDAGRSDRELGVELGARYLLRGCVRRDGATLIVSGRLVEAASGVQVWAERLTAPADEQPAVQADIAARVAGALALKIDDARLARARRQPIGHLEAYDCWLRGVDALRRGSRTHDDAARALFERALELDPHCARAWAGISLSHFNEWSCQAWERWDEKEQLAFEAARRAAELDDADHVVQLILGRILLYRREFERAERRLDLALEINPNDADALMQIGIGKTLLGRADQAIELMDRAIRLNPKHDDWYLGFRALPAFVLQRYGEAIRLGSFAVGAMVDAHAYLAAAHAFAGEDEHARAHVAAFLDDFRRKILFGREPEPGEPLRWIRHVNPFRDPRDVERLADGLRRAGLPADDEPVTVAPPRTAGAPEAVSGPAFRRSAGVWTMCWDGRAVQLVEVKGFYDLAAMLAAPGRALHCLALAGRPAPSGEADDVLDARARREVEERIRELQQELDVAEAHHDLARGAHARAELDALVESLSKALGIRQRSRKLGSATEKARSAVTWRIRSAIRKIADAHAGLGRHLENAVRTGTYCVYEPETRVDWEL